jgi:hypothetical protein
LSKIEYIDLGNKVYNIYNYRLKDLNSLISCLDEQIKKNKKNEKKTDYIEMTVNELNKFK